MSVSPLTSDGTTIPSHRFVVSALAALALAIVWCFMFSISSEDPWYRNADMNVHNMVDALAINSNLAPNPFAQPGVPLKYLLAIDYRIRHHFGLLPIWNMKKLGDSPDPLRAIPALIRIERVHSRILVIALILAAAGLTYSVTREFDAACLSIILLCGSAGLLFQGLLSRPELLCVGFGNVLALWCTWQSTSTQRWPAKHGWLFLAGLLGGLATLEKLPGICYVLVCYGWCWLAALIAMREGSEPAKVEHLPRPHFWSGLLPAAGAGATLWVLFQLDQFHDDLGPVVLWRLRFAATFITVLPLLAQCDGRSRLGTFLLERARELALLGGGTLAAIPLSYLALRGVLTSQPASQYMTGVLHFLVNPAPYMDSFLGGQEESRQALLASLRETPFLFGSTILVTLAICLVRSVSLRLKAFIGLLLVTALGLTYLMSKRHFADQYSIFPQVPLLLVWSLSLSALLYGRRTGLPKYYVHWTTPLAFSAAFILTVTVYLRVQPKYYHYQDDVCLPVSNLTLTFLFDHDAHTAAYLRLMKEHYSDRITFAKRLDLYLADPANRY